MHSSQVATWVTPARFAPYLDEADGDHGAAVALYVWNARISAAVFETLHHVEPAPRLPRRTGDRAEVAALMSSLVPFRNRLAHHETIMRRPIAGHYEEMLTLAGLIDPAASSCDVEQLQIETAQRSARVRDLIHGAIARAGMR